MRMLRAETMLFEPVLGMERTEIRSAWLARRVRLVLLRLIMVDVSGFRTDPMIEGVTSENALFSS